MYNNFITTDVNAVFKYNCYVIIVYFTMATTVRLQCTRCTGWLRIIIVFYAQDKIKRKKKSYFYMYRLCVLVIRVFTTKVPVEVRDAVTQCVVRYIIMNVIELWSVMMTRDGNGRTCINCMVVVAAIMTLSG